MSSKPSQSLNYIQVIILNEKGFVDIQLPVTGPTAVHETIKSSWVSIKVRPNNKRFAFLVKNRMTAVRNYHFFLITHLKHVPSQPHATWVIIT